MMRLSSFRIAYLYNAMQVTLLCVVVLFCHGHMLMGQCRVTGYIDAIPAGTVFLLDAQSRDTLAFSSIHNHTFSLEVKSEIDSLMAQPAVLVLLEQNRNFSQTLPVALECVSIRIDIDTLGKVRYSGSQAQDDFNDFLLHTQELTSNLMNQEKVIQDSVANALGAELENYFMDARNTKLSLFIAMLVTDVIQRRLIDPASMPQILELCQGKDESDSQMQRICDAIASFTMQWTNVPVIPFQGKLPSDSLFNIDSILGTRPIILDFWASWCGPCLREMPSLKELYAQDKIEIVGISIDASKSAWTKSLEKLQLPWINVWDQEGTIAKRYHVTSVPTKLVIDKDGVIIARNPENLNSVLENLKH